MGRAEAEDVILPVHPKEYLQQGLRYCGGYTIKAVLSSVGKDDDRHPKEYLLSSITLGFAYPSRMKRILEKHGVCASIRRANKSADKEKTEIVKRELDDGHPVILLVGNGYSHDGGYSALRRFFVSHWISIWGYNDRKQVFYVYDSFADARDVPIGNVRRSYGEIVRDWKGALYTKHMSFLYFALRF